MAKKKIPPGQVNQKNLRTLKALTNLMEDLDQKYSIKVGIIGDKASQNVPGTDLTMADLGAIHEFGATIKVTDKMRGFLHSQGVHLKKDTTEIVIPTRSFLRMPLMGDTGKKVFKQILNNSLSEQEDLNVSSYSEHSNLLEELANKLAQIAEDTVLQAFNTAGFGEWPEISELTKKRRQGDPSNPPLNDTGDLIESAIQSEVKKA